MHDTKSILTELMSLLEKKRTLFNNIMEITLAQKKDIEEDAADKIEGLISKKQSVINSIDEIDKSFSEKFELLKKQLMVNSLDEVDFSKYPELKNLKLKVEGIMSMAQDIMLIEESNKEKLKAIMNGLKKEINHINIGKKSVKAYEKPTIYNDGIYIDKKK